MLGLGDRTRVHPPFFGQLRELSSLVRLEMGAPRVDKPPGSRGRGLDCRNLPHLPAASLRAKLRAESLRICFHPCPSASSAAPQGRDSLLHLTQSLSAGVGGDMALAGACSLGLPSPMSPLANSWLSCLSIMDSQTFPSARCWGGSIRPSALPSTSVASLLHVRHWLIWWPQRQTLGYV